MRNIFTSVEGLEQALWDKSESCRRRHVRYKKLLEEE